ncbi:ROK family protein [Fictibacillus gelatini]|uniref:ROK family protein n=1 Tax=Fictibacillus gelatini TaxID=225985 RepID=UPI0004089C3A|nr:ROK family protein [Fictibacillus gelatini]
MLKQFIGLMSPKMKSLKRLYELIYKFGPISKSKLVELSGYKQATCARLIDELVEADLIYESGQGESTGGRKPAMYVIKPDNYYLIGVDITRVSTKIALLDLELNHLQSIKLDMTSSTTADYTLHFICEQIQQMLESRNIPLGRLLGIGVGAVGPLDREKGVFLNPKHFLSEGWENVNLVNRLKEAFDTVVLLENGANLAALGEYRRNHWKTADNLVYTMSGVGIRCGVISKGQVVRGNVDMEGAFGHVIVDVHGLKCSCGAYGCLEAYSSLSAIRIEVIKQLKRGKPSLLKRMVNQLEDIRFDHILYSIVQDDPLCSEIVRDAAFYYGIALSNLIYLVHPEVVIIGGVLGSHEPFYEVASETAKDRLKNYPHYQIQFHKASEGDNAVTVGAGSMVFDYYLEQ